MIAIGMTLLSASVGVAGAQGDPEQELADRYAPIVMLKAQDGECDDSGEPYAPMSVDVVLDNPLVVLRQVGPQNPVLTSSPGAADVFSLSESVFLDFPGSALSPGCVYEQDFRRFTEGQPAVVYAHLVTQADEPDQLALQYWFFWYYNDWNNKHEGDWEGIQLLFDVGSVEEALETEPVSVGFAQHEGGERADWDDDKLERQGTRPVVYSSAGSHASYFGQALYLGRSGSEGFGCDNTDGPSSSLDPEVVLLPDAVDDPDDPLAWLAFEGRWGERQSGPFNGPTGPALKERWTSPVDWHDELRARSVVVPGGDSTADTVISAFCGVVKWGSGQLITLKQNPVALLIGIAVVFAAISFGLGRTDWSAVGALPILRRRRAGQLIKASFQLFRQHIPKWLLIGLAYLPITAVVGALVRLLRLIPFIDAALESEPDVGAVGVALAAMIGGLGHFLGLTVVIAAVAVLMRGLEDNPDMTAGEAYRLTSRRIGGLLAAFVRGLVIVTVLLVSVVGIPWGIRQLVRYQLIAPVAMLEHEDGREILDRSSQLVKGRWLHTAAVIALLNALVAIVAAAAGLL
ncbi:MAG: Vps62-related protein, partial [Acidimicrobiia bacterium]|nr:Vps62-related protein [Acidimicrobiia bacterium]